LATDFKIYIYISFLIVCPNVDDPYFVGVWKEKIERIRPMEKNIRLEYRFKNLRVM
jgi:hypothetical protein